MQMASRNGGTGLFLKEVLRCAYARAARYSGEIGVFFGVLSNDISDSPERHAKILQCFFQFPLDQSNNRFGIRSTAILQSRNLNEDAAAKSRKAGRFCSKARDDVHFRTRWRPRARFANRWGYTN
jgi:hypothetical protein